MGTWMIGTGNISVNPQVDEELIKDYIQFSNNSFPEEYREEYFSNTWFLMKKTNYFQ